MILKKILSKKLLLAILSFLTALILWEIILQNSLLERPERYIHPQLDRTYKKGLFVLGTEGYCRTNINSSGFRGDEVSLPNANEIRIMVMGGSHTEGFQTADDSTYCSILQKKLKDLFTKNLRVLNAGRSGNSPAHYIKLSDFYKNTFHPDYTIIQLDDSDFTFDLMPDADGHFHIQKENNNYLIRKSKAHDTVLASMQCFPDFMKTLVYSSSAEISFRRYIQLKRGEDKKVVSDLGSYYKGNLDVDLVEWIIKKIKQKYPNPVIVFIPCINYFAKNEKSTRLELSLFSVCKKHNVPMIDIRTEFINYYKQTHQPPVGFNNTKPGSGHINGYGHRIIADKLANYYKGKIIK